MLKYECLEPDRTRHMLATNKKDQYLHTAGRKGPMFQKQSLCIWQNIAWHLIYQLKVHISLLNIKNLSRITKYLENLIARIIMGQWSYAKQMVICQRLLHKTAQFSYRTSMQRSLIYFLCKYLRRLVCELKVNASKEIYSSPDETGIGKDGPICAINGA